MKNKIIALLVLVSTLLIVVVLAPKEPISKAGAEDLTKKLPEISKLLTDKNVNWHVEATDKGRNWIVQVYQIVSYKDHPEANHESTFNWYSVNMKTGEITCSMFTYDSKGNYVKGAKVNNCN